jgi:type VI secretion system secreted protein VgrG
MGSSIFKSSQTRTLSVSGAALPSYGLDSLPILVPVRLKGSETLGRLDDYRYVLTLRTNDALAISANVAANIDLDKVIGTEVTVSIELEGIGEFIPGLAGNAGTGNIGAGIREITGLVSMARVLGEDGRSILYQLELRPWSYQATLNQDSRIFQGLNVIEVTDAVLSKYTFPAEKRLYGPISGRAYPARDIQRQAWESDWTFLQRVWEEWGIWWWFEYSDSAQRLVLCDALAGHKSHGPAYESIRYCAPSSKRIDEEHIHELSVTSRLTTGGVRLVDYDYTRPLANLTVNDQDPRDTAYADQEHYSWGDFSQPLADASGLSGTPNDATGEARHLARVLMESKRCIGLRAHGKGNLRGLTVGHTFTLTGYPQQSANREYLVVSCSLDIEDVSDQSGTNQSYRCEAEFEVQPANEPFRLARSVKKPRVGQEKGIVVGPANQEIWTDAQRRVKVQFEWDRQGKNDQNSGIWLRVAAPWQGANRGTAYIPRINDEVTVDHYHDDPDLPIVTSSVVNATHQPPWSLPDNHAVSGMRSRELRGTSSGHVALDDTQGQIQTQVSSDYGTSQLSLGNIRRILGTKGRQDARGKGFDLRTDLWGVLRALKGLLISTDGQSGAPGHAKNADEAVGRLTRAGELHEELTQAAQKNEAQLTGTDQSDVTKAIKDQIDAVQGDTSADENEFPELKTPDIVLASAAGIGTTATKSTHIASNVDFAVTTGRHVGIAAGKSLYASVLDIISLFALRGAIRLIAASGKISIIARENIVELISPHLVQLLSQDAIKILAKNTITWNAGGSQIVLNKDGFFVYTDGKCLFHASDVKNELPLTVPTGLMPLATHPIGLSCSALAMVELTDPAKGGTGSFAATSPPAPPIGWPPAQGAAGAPPATSAPPADGHTCTYTLKNIKAAAVTMNMESADYLEVDGNGQPVLDSNGRGILLSYGNASGTFDVSFDASNSVVTATVKVLVIPKTVRLHNPLTNEPLSNSDGTPKTAPFETMKERTPSNKAVRLIEDRPVGDMKNLPAMKLKIEAVLNQNKYSLTIAKCPKGNACACQIAVQFKIEFVTSKADEHHAVVNLFPQAERADSGNWGEVNVQFRGSTYQPILIEHVQAHEVGHLFSFPDEYYAGGGAVHRQYVRPDKTVNLALANNNPNRDTWQGVTAKNLMGLGVYNAVSDTPSYYFYRIRDWFHEKTGREWKIIPLSEAK